MLEVDFEQLDSAFTFKHHKWILLEKPAAVTTLLDALMAKFPEILESSWPERLSWGSMYSNGARLLSDTALQFPCLLEYYEPTFQLAQVDAEFNSFNPSYVVFEDDFLIGVFKPAKLPCMPARDQMRYNLKHQVEQYTKCTLHLPSRIDFSVSGLVMMSKNPLSHNKLQRLYETRSISKRYRLETANAIDWSEQICTLPIGKDARHPVLRSTDDPDGKPAQTDFRKLATRSGNTLVEARPITGRTHQIRVHAAALGAPIRGDKFYGGAKNEDLLLVSFQAVFQHPMTGAKMDIRLTESIAPKWALETDTTG